jgi:hypothetical protein
MPDRDREVSMIRRALLVALPLFVAVPTHAAFHLAHIAELNARGGGDPGEQYVEIVMEFGGQTVTANSVLAAWDCGGTFLGDLLVVPSNIGTGGAGVRWIMATTNPVGGIVPDFIIPSPGIPTGCGQVCWGAPGFIPPIDPDSWSRDDLDNNFVDCIAYGAYTGPTRSGSGSPTALTPGDGMFSLERVDDTTVAPACPSPENNAGTVGGYGPCTDPTTTTTTTITTTSTTSVTSTTTPPGTADLLGGKKLDLRVKAGKPEKSKLFIASQKDAALTLGRGAGSADDPTQHGGTLLVIGGSAGGAFTDVYPLDSGTGSWSATQKQGVVTGYSFKSGGPITNVKIKDGKTLAVKGKGVGLGHDLDDDPNPVAVVLAIGEHRYCLAFGGTPKFTPDKRFKATKAPTPGACADFPD